MKPSAIDIEELSGDKRRIRLIGPGLPFRGAGWPVEQRLVTRWYHDNPEATQHVLGAIDLPSSWNGVWNSTRLADAPCEVSGSPIVKAFDLYLLFDDVVRRARLLRVTWAAGDERKIARIGRLHKLDPQFDRADDIRWSMEFEWIGRAAEPRRVSSSRGDDFLAASNSLLSALADVSSAVEAARIRQSRAGLPGSADVSTLGDLETLSPVSTAMLAGASDFAATATTRAGRVADLLSKVTSAPRQLVDQTASAASAARAASIELSDEMSRVPFELMVEPTGLVAPALKAAVYFGRTSRALEKASGVAVEFERLARKRMSALSAGRAIDRAAPVEIIGATRARAGDTFLLLSKRYYGTPDRGDAIARANGYPAYQIAPPVGAVLVVPRLVAVGSPRAV